MKELGTYLLMLAMMVFLAFAFVRGLELQEFVDQAQAAKRMQVLDTPPAAPTGLQPNYGAPSEPKVRHFQDASRKARGVE
jgi:hypothetical protein